MFHTVKTAWVLTAACAMAHADDTTPPAVVYTEAAAAQESLIRQWDGAAWSASSSAAAIPGPIGRQKIIDCPIRDELTLTALCQDGSLHLASWDGASWDAPFELASDTGSTDWRVFDAAYEQVSGDVLIAYRKTANASVYFKLYDGMPSVEHTLALPLDGPPVWIKLAPKPGSDEMILLAATAGTLYGAVWNGNGFTDALELDPSVTGSDPSRDVAFTTTGQGLVTWASQGNVMLSHRSWDGAAWSAQGAGPMVGRPVKRITLAANPSGTSTEIMALAAGEDAGGKTLVGSAWDGTAWRSVQTLETALASATQARFAAAYEPDGSLLVAAWHEDGQTALRRRTWDPTTASWSSEAIGLDLGAPTDELKLVSNGGMILGAARTIEADLDSWDDYAVYSANGPLDVGGATVIGSVGINVPGVNLPTPPPAPLGTDSINIGNAQDVTIDPGVYASLSVGQNCTLRLRTGDYVFDTVDLDDTTIFRNQLTLIVDTPAGDVNFIVRTGDVRVANMFEVVRNGAGEIFFHVLNGDFFTRNSPVFEASVIVYSGDIELGDNALVTGRLLADGQITVSSGTVDAGGVLTYISRLWTLSFSAGLPGSLSQAAAQLPGSWDGQFDLNQRIATPATVRIVRWREIGRGEGQ